jgi:hypothetical protein
MPSASSRPIFCFVIALMLLMVRVADAHAHLCYDGKEPPSAIHLACGGAHPCETDKSTGHTGDKDVQVSADLLVKKSVSADSWMPPLLASIFQYIAPPSNERISVEVTIVRPTEPAYLRPPLRGPPA